MAPGAQHLIPILVLAPLVAWRMYSRVRRNIGRQHLGKWRPWITLTVFPVIAILISLGALAAPARLAAMLGGIVAGIVLGVFGTRHTRFENTPEGIFYTPHAHIGIAVSALFIGRVVWRMFQLYSMGEYVQPNPTDFASSPVTLSIFGLLAGYYVTYAVGLIRYKLGVERGAAAGT
jgi:hypothetical protein